jgi:hypothetical protein
MRTFISWFFYILGVVFFLLILAGGYLYVADPFGLREMAPLFFQESPRVTTEAVSQDKAVPVKVADKNPALSASQEAALENVGINPAALPCG